MEKLQGKEVTYFAGIEKNLDAKKIIKDSADVVRHALSRDYGKTGFVNYFSLGSEEEYNNKVDTLRKDRVAFCGERAGMADISTDDAGEVANLLDNTSFTSAYNAIEAGVIRQVFTNIESNAINVIANVDTVGYGNSKTYKLDTKGLPVAQRGSYMANVTYLNGVTATPFTITPQVYSIGIAMDLVRIIKGDLDWAKESGKVIMGLLYAQYKLVVNALFSTGLLSGTPFITTAYDVEEHVALIDILTAVNNAPVKGYGTVSALRKIGIGALELNGVAGGFAVQDEIIRDSYISHVNGIDYIKLNQAYDYSAPLAATLDDASKQMLIPNDKVLLLSAADDKPVKLVREDYVRVRAVEPQENSVLRREYAYSMAFDAGVATLSQFAIISVD